MPCPSFDVTNWLPLTDSTNDMQVVWFFGDVLNLLFCNESTENALIVIAYKFNHSVLFSTPNTIICLNTAGHR